jgi:uncharacterized Zn finger protein (UPF0148 family)
MIICRNLKTISALPDLPNLNREGVNGMAKTCPRCGIGELNKKKGYIYCDTCIYEEYDGEDDEDDA